MPSADDAYHVLLAACRISGLNGDQAELIRAAENTIFRLSGGVVARVSRAGQSAAAAAKEVTVSRWLKSVAVPVVEALDDVEQPAEVRERAVTFWRELPPHRQGSTAEVADMLRLLHALVVPPELCLPPLAPFVRLAERISVATVFSEEDRAWLVEWLGTLQAGYEDLSPGLPWCAVHGDAWGGNIVVTEHGPVMLDLERFAFGPPEWDLTSAAFDYTTCGYLSQDEWREFCRRYGYDVTEWSGYAILRDIRELRKITFAAQMAEQYPYVQDQALYRLACIKGEHGPRPWHWAGVP
jgi:aminoglycoside phosphotransferase (APT) family kinase protein